MNNNNIIILENKILYQILNEIKNYFSFEIKSFNLEDFKKTNLTHSIIVSNFKFRDLLLKKKIKTIFLLNKNENPDLIKNNEYIFCPFNVHNLIEKINIELIKQKYTDQSSINILNYSLDLNSRVISNKSKNLKLTEREVDIILFLIQNKKPQKVSSLQIKVWGYSSDLETHTVETHIYRLRKKFLDFFSDNNFIISNDDGYLIK